MMPKLVDTLLVVLPMTSLPGGCDQADWLVLREGQEQKVVMALLLVVGDYEDGDKCYDNKLQTENGGDHSRSPKGWCGC